MKFFVDHQLPPALAGWIRTRGHEAVTARSAGLRSIDDDVVWRYATSETMVIVTKDEDFANFALSMNGPQVLWVRIGNTVNRVLLSRFEAAWSEILPYLESGARIVELR